MNSNHCPTCNRRIDPVSLSDLHRGRKVVCPYCLSTLRAGAAGSASALASFAVALWPMLENLLSRGAIGTGAMLFAAAVLVVIWLAPPGLIGGAPWVRIYSIEGGLPAKGGLPAMNPVGRRKQAGAAG